MTKSLPKILAICGSNSSRSVNLSLIKIIQAMAAGKSEITIYRQLDSLPQFNPDLDIDPAPAEVQSFRQRVKDSNGVLICSPEYAMGIPGSLKNAIDWTVSSAEFSKKPVALITASSMGHKAHAALLDVLNIIEAGLSNETNLLIPFAKTKIKEDQIIDANTRSEVEALISGFILKIKG